LGLVYVRGLSRIPQPPARITAFTFGHPWNVSRLDVEITRISYTLSVLSSLKWGTIVCCIAFLPDSIDMVVSSQFLFVSSSLNYSLQPRIVWSMRLLSLSFSLIQGCPIQSSMPFKILSTANVPLQFLDSLLKPYLRLACTLDGY